MTYRRMLLISVLAAAGTACSVNQPSAEPIEQAARRYEQVREQVGQTCARDRECPSPLRCIAGTCSEPAAMVGGHTEITPTVLFYGRQGEAAFYIEVVDEIEERSRGLMHRPSMLDDWGMLFVYPSERPLSFWMQNTFIALDMIFLDDQGLVVGVVENAEPLTTASRSVPGASRYVLELNAGQAARAGIEAGVRSEFLNVSAETLSDAEE